MRAPKSAATTAWTLGNKAAAGIVAAVLLVVLGGAAYASTRADDPVTVARIVDGDTLDVSQRGETTRIRLLNVDTPETVDPNEPVQCMGPEATAFLRGLLPVGTTIRLEYDVERVDRYGRDLAGVFVGETLVNAEVARAGLGVAVIFGKNDRFYTTVLAAQEEAVSANRGLYSTDIACTIPQQVTAYDLAAATVADNAAPAASLSVEELEPLTANAATVAAAGSGLVALFARNDDTAFPMLAFARGTAHSVQLPRLRTTVTTATAVITSAKASMAKEIVDKKEQVAAAQRAAEAAAAAAAEAQRLADEEAQRQAAAEAQRQADAAAAAKATAAAKAAAAAKARAAAAAKAAAGSVSSGSGTSGSASAGSSSGTSDTYTGCRAYSPGGKTYTKIPCP